MSGESTILLVEDDPFDVRLIRRAFTRAGVTAPVQSVGDGERAVRYLQGEGEYSDRDLFPLPRLILLDLKLPRKSGLEVLEWLKDVEPLRRLPVVVLTSSRENRDVNRAYDLGANSYLVKPVDPAALEAMAASLGLYWLQLNEQPEVRHGG